MRVARVASVVALLALAGLLAVFALEAWRVPGQVREADARLLSRERDARAWTALDAFVPSLLGLGDDRSYRLAVGRFLLARRSVDPIGERPAAAVVLSTDASVLLAHVEHGRSSARLRSGAANLDAVVQGEGAELSGDNAALSAAVDLLRTAIRLDHANEAAKANLERLLGGVLPSGALAPAPSGQLGGEPGAGGVGSGY